MSPLSAEDARADFDALWIERAFIESQLVNAAASGGQLGQGARFGAAVEALGANSERVAGALSPTLGPSTANAIESILARRDKLTVAYARALASGDEAKIDEAERARDFDASAAVDAISNNNPQLARHVLRSLLEESSRKMADQSRADNARDPAGAAVAVSDQLALGVEVGDKFALAFTSAFPALYSGDSESVSASARQAIANGAMQLAYLQVAEVTGEIENATVAAGGRALVAGVDERRGRRMGNEEADAIEGLWRERAGLLVDAADGRSAAPRTSSTSERLRVNSQLLAAQIAPASHQEPTAAALTNGGEAMLRAIDARDRGDFAALYRELNQVQNSSDEMARRVVTNSGGG